MIMDNRRRFEKYVARLTDDEVLDLNRVVSRAAARIYGPMYRDKQFANSRTARGVYMGRR
jgi:hypothetical protein